MKSSKTLLIIGFVWPEPRSSAAGSRMLQLIGQFKQQGYEITFASTAKRSQNSFDLQSLGVEERSIKLNEPSFDEFIKALKPDIVIFDRFMTEEQFGWRVAEQCPDTIRILDAEDFHGLRKARGEALKHHRAMSIEDLQSDITKREIASMYRCDLTLVISEYEMELFQNQFFMDKQLLCYLPFLVESISLTDQKKLPNFKERQHFVSIGNFLHPPNYDAVRYLKETIWPLIRAKLPKAQIHIYGAYAQQKALQLHSKSEGFFIKGFAEDVANVMQEARVCLAPLRFGAGLKGKLIDAMRYGTPCIMSGIASEGMFGKLLPNGYIANKPEEFAAYAVSLYNNGEEWNTFQENGFKCLKERFDAKNFSSVFEQRIIDLSENYKTYRQNNFIGQLLMHHSVQSTKYMSKWIEEKNR